MEKEKNKKNKDLTNPYSLNDYGSMLLDSGKYQESLDYFLKAYELMPCDTIGLNIATAYHNLKKFDHEEAMLKALTINFPDSFESLINYGALLSDDKKDYENALAYFLKAKAINDNSDVNYNIGLMYEKINDLENAKKYYQKSLNKKDSPSDAYVSLGLIYQQEGNKEKALQIFKEGIDKYKYCALLWYNLGCLYLRLNDEENARMAFKLAININNDYQKYFDGDIDTIEFRSYFNALKNK